MFGDEAFRRALQEHNCYTLDLWPVPGEPRHNEAGRHRLLAVTFDLWVGRAAFLGAARRFPGRELDLRDRCRIVCSAEHQRHVAEILREVQGESRSSGPP